MTEAVFLTLLFAGVAAMVSGVFVTRWNWRPDLPPYGRGTSALRVLLHPEEFTAMPNVAAIRWLNRCGLALVAAAVVVVLVEIAAVMQRG